MMPFYHITTATHDSRTSQRMVDYKVRELRDNGLRPKAQSIWLELEDELFISEIISGIIIKDKFKVYSYNICGDHFHMLLACEKSDLIKIIQKIKAVTSREYNIKNGNTITREHAPLPNNKTRGAKQNSLWTQKFGCKEITTKTQLANTIDYIKNNRIKHKLPTNIHLNKIIANTCMRFDEIEF